MYIFDDESFHLPIQNKTSKDFADFLGCFFDRYIERVTESRILNSGEEKKLKSLKSTIIGVLDNHYKGKTYLAYNRLYEDLKKIEAYLPIRTFDQNDLPFFYRLRIGDNNSFTKEEMFHISYKNRGLVKSFRYSIAGHPTLYLGQSSFVCWNELRKPEFNKINISKYTLKKDINIKLLDFGYRPQDIKKRLEMEESMEEESFIIKDLLRLNDTEIKNYLIIFPLLASCSVIVKNTEHFFKPEYLIPQAILQYVMKSNSPSKKNENIVGVRYFSVSTTFNFSKEIDHNPVNFIHNYAFPTVKKSDEFCPILSEIFNISKPISWAVFKTMTNYYNFSKINNCSNDTSVVYDPTVTYREYFHSNLEIIADHPVKYMDTEFSHIEAYLLQYETSHPLKNLPISNQ